MNLRLALIAASALALSACKGECRQLSERLCGCNDEPSATQEACRARVAQRESQVEPTDEENARCAEFLKVCKCGEEFNREEWIDVNSAEGKQACGRAR